MLHLVVVQLSAARYLQLYPKLHTAPLLIVLVSEPSLSVGNDRCMVLKVCKTEYCMYCVHTLCNMTQFS